MGNYTVIEETGSAIVKLLRQHLVPDFVEHQEKIDLCSLEDKGDLAVAVCLYNIQENEDLVGIGFKDRGITKQSYPSLFLNLYYMITVYSESDLKYRARQEQQILGRVMQVMHDYPILPGELLTGGRLVTYPVKMEFDKVSMEDKMKIYSVPGKAYKNSLFYRVYPVELESTLTKKVRRVADLDTSVKEGDGKEG